MFPSSLFSLQLVIPWPRLMLHQPGTRGIVVEAASAAVAVSAAVAAPSQAARIRFEPPLPPLQQVGESFSALINCISCNSQLSRCHKELWHLNYTINNCSLNLSVNSCRKSTIKLTLITNQLSLDFYEWVAD